MIVDFAGGFNAVSGTLFKGKNGSKVICTTRKAPSTNPHKFRMYIRTASSYKRKGKPSKKELNARALFTQRQAYVQELLNAGKVKSRAEAWKLAKLAYPVDGKA